MIAGDLADYLIALIVEREFGSHVSLFVFLALYFLFLWVAWGPCGSDDRVQAGRAGRATPISMNDAKAASTPRFTSTTSSTQT